jgi:predicted nucleic acid-binding protein
MEWIKGREPASTSFDKILDLAEIRQIELHMSRINYGEVVYSIRKAVDIADPITALRAFLALPIHVHTADDALVDEAVELKATYTFSYADAFAAALARRLNVPLVTGDFEFRSLEAKGLLRLLWVDA